MRHTRDPKKGLARNDSRIGDHVQMLDFLFLAVQSRKAPCTRMSCGLSSGSRQGLGLDHCSYQAGRVSGDRMNVELGP